MVFTPKTEGKASSDSEHKNCSCKECLEKRSTNAEL
jgi:hypothetical protein